MSRPDPSIRVSLIIAAGGTGERFRKGSKGRNRLNKLFFALAGQPVLSHTLKVFQAIPQIREIILAVPPRTQNWVRRRLLNGPRYGPPIRLVPGGKTRAESVWKALARTSPKNDWVLVHDGARPFPPKDAVQEMLEQGRGAPTDGIILARPVVPTLKRVAPKNGEVLETLDRSSLFEAETPQLVRRSLLFKAYRENPKAFLATDESSLIESVGGRVKVFPHSGWNLKVTTPEDLRLAEAWLIRHCETAGGGAPACRQAGSNPGTSRLLRRFAPRNDESVIRIGLGRDTHRLVKGRKLYLGGVWIPFEKGALGHSDGDVLLHAVSDAILGALGAGDIGEWFSDRNPRTKNIRSEKILRRILEEASRRHWTASQVDSVIILEKPRLGAYKKRVRRNLAKLFRLPEGDVSVKAKTAEGLGPEGEGLAVTAEALVQLRKSL